MTTPSTSNVAMEIRAIVRDLYLGLHAHSPVAPLSTEDLNLIRDTAREVIRMVAPLLPETVKVRLWGLPSTEMDVLATDGEGVIIARYLRELFLTRPGADVLAPGKVYYVEIGGIRWRASIDEHSSIIVRRSFTILPPKGGSDDDNT